MQMAYFGIVKFHANAILLAVHSQLVSCCVKRDDRLSQKLANTNSRSSFLL